MASGGMCNTLRQLRRKARRRERITADQIMQAYKCDNSSPPRQKYLSKGRDTIRVDTATRRREEHVAKALFLLGKIKLVGGVTLRDNLKLEFLDYQFPLKSKQADMDVGKVDLIGCVDKESLALVELKTEGNNKDSPLDALIEILDYGAIVFGNFEKIAGEICENFGHKLRMPLFHIILAEQAYWGYWKKKKGWNEFCELYNDLRNRAVTIQCLEFKCQVASTPEGCIHAQNSSATDLERTAANELEKLQNPKKQPYRTDEWSSVATNITNMANSVMGFGSFVDKLYRRQEQQYLFACLALENAAALDETSLRTFATAIMEQKRPARLGELLGHQVDEKACQVFYKLGSSPHPATLYRDVLRAISVKPIGKALSHASTITPTVLLALSEFVAERLPVALLHLLSSGHHTPLVDACISLARALPEKNRVDAIGALANVRTPTAVGGWFDRWILCLDFPTPPFTGNDTLRPIINFSELASDGKLMRRCIANYAEDIMAGAACVYHWSGDQQATILLKKDAAGLWQFNEMRGVDNQIIGCIA